MDGCLPVGSVQKKSFEGTHGEFYTCSRKLDPITPGLLDEYMKKEGRWKTFAQFERFNYGIWRIHLDEGCTCPTYLKFNVCKHLLGMKIRLKQVEVPVEAKLVPLGQKRKRGRPTKARKVLIIQ